MGRGWDVWTFAHDTISAIKKIHKKEAFVTTVNKVVLSKKGGRGWDVWNFEDASSLLPLFWCRPLLSHSMGVI